MPIRKEATVDASLGWSQTDTEQGISKVSNVGAVGINQYLQYGTDVLQVDEIWHDFNELPIEGEVVLDLKNLSLQLFNDIVIVSFSLGRALAIKNNNGSEGTIWIGPGEINGLMEPFGDAELIPIPPGGLSLYTNFIDGWIVDDTHKTIRIVGGDVAATYEIAIAGIT
jgi:hypothetical protein